MAVEVRISGMDCKIREAVYILTVRTKAGSERGVWDRRCMEFDPGRRYVRHQTRRCYCSKNTLSTCIERQEKQTNVCWFLLFIFPGAVALDVPLQLEPRVHSCVAGGLAWSAVCPHAVPHRRAPVRRTTGNQ